MITLQTAMLALAISGGGGRETILLDFSADWCVPCQQMVPAVRELVVRGYPVRQVNFDRNRALAAKYGVNMLPCFVMLVDGQVVDRVVGGTTFSRLERMCKMGRAARPANQPSVRPGPAPKAPHQPIPAVPGELLFVNLPGETSGSGPRDSGSSGQRLPPAWPQPAGGTGGSVDDLLAAAVRLRIKDPDGHSCGSGTIIDARGGEALILTCGHIFRDSKGNGPIEVDLFGAGAAERVPGSLLTCDLERDLALVTIRTPSPVKVARVAPVGHNVAQGARVINIGCNNGEPPTARFSRVTSLDKYIGPPNLQVSGVPVQGRSGGGLFSEDGLVIGVCNAADPEENEGLYTALAALHEELQEADLLAVCQPGGEGLASGAPLASSQPPPMAREMPGPADLARVPHASGVPRDNRTDLGGADDAERLSGEEEAALEEIRRRKSEGAEVVCVVRSRSNPEARSEIIVLDNVSSAFLEQLACESRTYTPNEQNLTSLTAPAAGRTAAGRGPAMRKTVLEFDKTPATSARRARPSSWQPHWR